MMLKMQDSNFLGLEDGDNIIRHNGIRQIKQGWI